MTEIQRNYISHESTLIYVILIQIIENEKIWKNEKIFSKIIGQKITLFWKTGNAYKSVIRVHIILVTNRNHGKYRKFWSKKKV